MKYILIWICMTPVIVYRFIHIGIFIFWNFKIPKYIYLRIQFPNEKLPEKYRYLRYPKGVELYCAVSTIFASPIFSVKKIGENRVQSYSYDEDEISFWI